MSSPIPSLYFSKSGSAASWYLNTATELQVLAAALGDSPPSRTEDTSPCPEIAELPDLPEPDADQPDLSTPRLTLLNVGIPQGRPRVHHDCTCACHDLPPTQHDHDRDDSASPNAPLSSDTQLSLGARPFTLIDVPDDEALFIAPRRAPVPSGTPSRTSSMAPTPSLARPRSSDADDQSISTFESSSRLFLRSWSDRLSSGWRRTSIASVTTIQSTSTTGSLKIANISKPQPIRHKRLAEVPAECTGVRDLDFQAFQSNVSLVQIYSTGDEYITISPRLARPKPIYSPGPPSSQIGRAFRSFGALVI